MLPEATRMIFGDSGKSLRISLSAFSCGSVLEKKKYSLTLGFRSTAQTKMDITIALTLRQTRTGGGVTGRRQYSCFRVRVIGFFTLDRFSQRKLLLGDGDKAFRCTGPNPLAAEIEIQEENQGTVESEWDCVGLILPGSLVRIS
jgi:hypothetical protein